MWSVFFHLFTFKSTVLYSFAKGFEFFLLWVWIYFVLPHSPAILSSKVYALACVLGIQSGPAHVPLLLAVLAGNEGECQSFSSKSERPPRSLPYWNPKHLQSTKVHTGYSVDTHKVFLFHWLSKGQQSKNWALMEPALSVFVLKGFPLASTCNFSCTQITVYAHKLFSTY